jgi:hypothetical protein
MDHKKKKKPSQTILNKNNNSNNKRGIEVPHFKTVVFKKLVTGIATDP